MHSHLLNNYRVPTQLSASPVILPQLAAQGSPRAVLNGLTQMTRQRSIPDCFSGQSSLPPWTCFLAEGRFIRHSSKPPFLKHGWLRHRCFSDSPCFCLSDSLGVSHGFTLLLCSSLRSLCLCPSFSVSFRLSRISSLACTRALAGMHAHTHTCSLGCVCPQPQAASQT